MDKLKELKAEAYDILAEIEAHGRVVEQLKQKLAAKNNEIAAEMQKEPKTKEAKA